MSKLPLSRARTTWMLAGLLLLAGATRLLWGAQGASPPGASWHDDDYTEVFRPVLEHYGRLPLSKADFCRFGTAAEFERLDRNRDGLVDVAEFQAAFMSTQEDSVDE
jgi:hypothetical protein